MNRSRRFQSNENDRIAGLKDSNEKLRDELRKEILALNQAERNIRIKSWDIKKLNECIARLEQQLQSLKGENDELHATIKVLRCEVAQLEKEKRVIEEYIIHFEAKLSERDLLITKIRKLAQGSDISEPMTTITDLTNNIIEKLVQVVTHLDDG